MYNQKEALLRFGEAMEKCRLEEAMAKFDESVQEISDSLEVLIFRQDIEEFYKLKRKLVEEL